MGKKKGNPRNDRGGKRNGRFGNSTRHYREKNRQSQSQNYSYEDECNFSAPTFAQPQGYYEQQYAGPQPQNPFPPCPGPYSQNFVYDGPQYIGAQFNTNAPMYPPYQDQQLYTCQQNTPYVAGNSADPPLPLTAPPLPDYPPPNEQSSSYYSPLIEISLPTEPIPLPIPDVHILNPPLPPDPPLPIESEKLPKQTKRTIAFSISKIPSLNKVPLPTDDPKPKQYFNAEFCSEPETAIATETVTNPETTELSSEAFPFLPPQRPAVVTEMNKVDYPSVSPGLKSASCNQLKSPTEDITVSSPNTSIASNESSLTPRAEGSYQTDDKL